MVPSLSPHPQAGLWPPPPASDAFFRNLGLSCPIPKQLLSKRASQAPAPPSQAFLVSVPAVRPGEASCSFRTTASHIPTDNRLTRLFHPRNPSAPPQPWRPPDWCMGRLSPFPKRSEASSTTAYTGEGVDPVSGLPRAGSAGAVTLREPWGQRRWGIRT